MVILEQGVHCTSEKGWGSREKIKENKKNIFREKYLKGTGRKGTFLKEQEVRTQTPPPPLPKALRKKAVPLELIRNSAPLAVYCMQIKIKVLVHGLIFKTAPQRSCFGSTFLCGMGSVMCCSVSHSTVTEFDLSFDRVYKTIIFQ